MRGESERSEDEEQQERRMTRGEATGEARGGDNNADAGREAEARVCVRVSRPKVKVLKVSLAVPDSLSLSLSPCLPRD